jgi:hypothetical protein
MSQTTTVITPLTVEENRNLATLSRKLRISKDKLIWAGINFIMENAHDIEVRDSIRYSAHCRFMEDRPSKWRENLPEIKQVKTLEG